MRDRMSTIRFLARGRRERDEPRERNERLGRRGAAVLLLALGTGLSCGDSPTAPTAPPGPPPPPPPPPPSEATSVTVAPGSAELTALGDTVRLSAEVRDQRGAVMPSAAVTWSTSDDSVVSADGSGLVTARGNGSATITAASGSASGTATVTVTQAAAAVSVSPAAETLVVGDTVRLSAAAADARGHSVAVAAFAWTSSAASVAAVDSTGLVTGVGEGAATITAVAGSASGTAAITVERAAPVPAAVTVAPTSAELTALGGTVLLSAEVRDQHGEVMPSAAVTWSTSDRSVAAVDASGLVTAAGNGTATITAMSGPASGTAMVTVAQAAVSAAVSPPAGAVAVGDTLRLSATAFDANGHPVAFAAFAWSSSDPSVATVNASGVVRGVAEGSAVVAAVSGDVSAEARITVASPDRVALTALYEATDGPLWRNNANWLTDAPLGEWGGVRTDGSGRVVGLRLRYNGLRGPLPRELGLLARLRMLDLENNDLEGPIPPELGRLARLDTLNLGLAGLTGAIPPELGRLANLELLVLSDNDLAGSIPPTLEGLTDLKQLSVGNNSLTGSIPPEIARLAQLEFLSLYDNDLAGTIPPGLGRLANLRILELFGNPLTGTLPPELGALARLESLMLGDTHLTGPVPSELLNLKALNQISFNNTYGLCAPETAAFTAWLGGIRYVGGPFCNESDRTVLERLHEATGGADWTRSGGWPDGPLVGEWYGVRADSLGRVVGLDLGGNGLSGTLPPDVGNLAQLAELRIGGNPGLTGRLPSTLARLDLRELRYADTGLCVPAEAAFREWMATVASHEGTGEDCAARSERDILFALYEATGGSGWKNRDGWLSDRPLDEWHGVTTDDSGRVTALRLQGNRLDGGPIPPELGDLTQLKLLNLTNNNVIGPIPPELGRLAELRQLHLGYNSLWDPIPSELGRLAKLGHLNLGSNYLKGPIPAELGNLAQLVTLDLSGNRLTGPIPPELGRLVRLQRLDVGKNNLLGRIPVELGNFTELYSLSFGSNRFTGPIPPELGHLVRLEYLDLGNNNLSGSIPTALGGLTDIVELSLSNNSLSGPIPRELGGLANLERLLVAHNALTGPIPPELGGLAKLDWLLLNDNRLSGAVPPELGNLSLLTNLNLQRNDLLGPLPVSLTSLRNLEVLATDGTGLCAPSREDFAAWLRTIPSVRLPPCAEEAIPAYLVQAVQSREFPVPLVAGEEALLRVFPTAPGPTDAEVPPVRVSLYLDGPLAHTAYIPGRPVSIPTYVDEGSMERSSNAPVPAEFVRPGLEMVVEIDPDGTVDPALGVARRIPATGRLPVDVRDMPELDLTLIPFLWTQAPDSAVLEPVANMAADPWGHELLWQTRTLLPVGNLRATARDPVLTSTANVNDLLEQTEAIRIMEGGDGHYLGMITGTVFGTGIGIAYWPGRASVSSVLDAYVIAHELGHNLSLGHAPCEAVKHVDPFFPSADGYIGAWGYDFRHGGVLVRPDRPDLMSYCGRPWISDYHFAKALEFRLLDEGASAAGARAPAASLLLWGGADAEGAPRLEPAFVVDAPPTLPVGGGAWEIAGRDAAGRTLFSLRFNMAETADGEGRSSFVFALPVRPEWAGRLVTIALTGPGGTALLDGETDRPMVILRDSGSGRVRGFLRDFEPGTLAGAAAAEAEALAATRGLEALFSRGLPGPEAWPR